MSQTKHLCSCYCKTMMPDLVVLVACGSFNPITTMHLRMMELARDAVEKTWSFQLQEEMDTQCQVRPPRRQVVVAGLLSPVADAYGKAGLAPARSRCRLARLACASTSDWIAVDSWEASQPHWTLTRPLLERIQKRVQMISQNLPMGDNELNEDSRKSATEAWKTLADYEDPLFGEVSDFQNEDLCKGSATNAWIAAQIQAFGHIESQVGGQICGGERQSFAGESIELPQIRVKLVCGADLLESFATPNTWSKEDMISLVRDFGIICISRPESDGARLFHEMDILSRYEQNFILATEWCRNGLSSTLVRRALSRGQSVRYLVPDAALEEIFARGLYGATRPARPRSLIASSTATAVVLQAPKSSSEKVYRIEDKLESEESPSNQPNPST